MQPVVWKAPEPAQNVFMQVCCSEEVRCSENDRELAVEQLRRSADESVASREVEEGCPGCLSTQIDDFLSLGYDERPAATDVETLIFLDVDGVLNIGIQDPGCSALLLNAQNLELADSLTGPLGALPVPLRENLSRIRSVLQRELPHGDGSYRDFTCSPELEASNVLVRRLVYILGLAGANAEIILSSNWRHRKYKSRVEGLELAISTHLGRPFVFKSRTKLCNEVGGRGRLQTLGDHLAALGKERDVMRPLNVLVLDDFAITAFGEGKMDIEGETIRSPQEAANYLQRRYAPTGRVPFRCGVIHTYDEWSRPDGATVRLGSGLTLDMVCEAVRFLGQRCPQCPEKAVAGPFTEVGYERPLDERSSPPHSAVPPGADVCSGATPTAPKAFYLWSRVPRGVMKTARCAGSAFTCGRSCAAKKTRSLTEVL